MKFQIQNKIVPKRENGTVKVLLELATQIQRTEADKCDQAE